MKKFILLIFILSFTVQCGFKVVDQNINIFEISEITTIGDKRINYRIKNKLLSTSQEGKDKVIKINLDTKKTRNIKEKNIKNIITKYEIIIVAEVSFRKLNETKLNKFNVNVSGDYTTSKQASITRNNEKELVKLLTNKISDKILKELKYKLDDL
jgi:outer membrane lipopolysaccharide assembly protein LptE/RlpB|tara:strand:- start:57 stop:521 length:465 start_codon:yes stop_codon:yes gene_type:complete